MNNPKYPHVYDNTLGKPFKSSLSKPQKELLMHALGLDRGNTVYRNYFSADEHHVDMDRLKTLVNKGMLISEPSPLSKDTMFFVTEQGRQALVASGEEFTNFDTEYANGS
jgi:hypothetical protein